MLDITPAVASVIACYGTAEQLDAVPAGDAFACRVAPDELLLVAPETSGAATMSAACAALATGRAPGLAIDLSDAWSVWTVSGDADQIFCRLSFNPMPQSRPGIVQGMVASVPAKVLLPDGTGRVHVMVPSVLRHHLPQRIAEACADLSPAFHDPASLRLR